MKKSARYLLSLLTMSMLCSSVVAYAGQTAAQPASTTSADGTALPVSVDRIRKALTAPEPTGPPIRKDVAEGDLPRFVVQTEAPRTLTLRSYLDDGTAVSAYVRPPFDPYHTEFLEMTTPDAYKGCGQFAGDQGACAQVMSSRVASGLVWQQLLSRGVNSWLRGMFKQQPQQP